MVFDVFISYSRMDMYAAEQIRSILEDAGLNCFTDRHNIPPGANYVEYLKTAIKKSKVFLYIASEKAYESKWSHSELNEFLKDKGVQELIVYQIDDSPLPKGLNTGNCFVFSRISSTAHHWNDGITDLELASKIISVISHIHIVDEAVDLSGYSPSVFITHSHSDNAIAKEVYDFFCENHIRCWLDTIDIPMGVPYAKAIMDGLHSCDSLLVLYSKNSVNSHDMLDEIQEAHTTNMRIIPFLLDKTPLMGQFRYYLARRQWVEAYPDYRVQLGKLLEALKNPNQF